MKTKLVVSLLVFLGWACKEKPETQQPKAVEIKVESKKITQESPIIKELMEFGEVGRTDLTDVNRIFQFKEIDTNGAITEIEVDRAVALYHNLSKRSATISYPIFEIKDTETAILPVKGVGFGGAIWAKVWVDRNTLEIKKIAFEHKAESDDYGAVMTQTAFESQFIGKKINLEQNTFGLQKAIEKINDAGHLIDGISGATVTSEGVVEMVNEGMKNYRNYLSPENGT